MKVKSDKLWQEQLEILNNTMDAETVEIYLNALEIITGEAESKIEKLHDGNAGDKTVEYVRQGVGELAKQKGYLIPDAISSILVVLILHWEYGQEFGESLSPIEFSLVAEAMARNLEENISEASSGPVVEG